MADFFTLAIGYYLNGHNYDIVQLLNKCSALLSRISQVVRDK
jgi:hypothetical protein